MSHQAVTRDGNMFIQYGGEEDDGDPLGEMLDRWTEKLRKVGNYTQLIEGLKSIEPRSSPLGPFKERTDAEFRGKLDKLATSLGLPVNGRALDATVATDWGFIRHTLDEDHLEVTDALAPAGDLMLGQPAPAPASAPAPPEPTTAPEPAPPPAPEPAPGARAKTAANDLKATGESLSGASSLEKIKLLEAIQLDPNLRAMVQAGMLNWADLMKTNDGSVVNSDGTKPEMILDEAKLQDVQSKLLRLGLQQQAEADMQVQRYQRQRTTSGAKPGAGFYGNKSVYMGPRYTPGRLPNTKNVSLL